jgi:hypothetical protein
MFLVMNLQHILDFWDFVIGKPAATLLDHMRHHRRNMWKDQALKIDEDKTAISAPVLRARRRTGGWIYSLFVLECLFVALPVHEILVVREHYESAVKALGWHQKPALQKLEEGDGQHKKPATDPSGGQRVQQNVRTALELARKQEEEAEGGSVRRILSYAFFLVRLLFLPVWIVIVFLVYIGIVTILALRSKPDSMPVRTAEVLPPTGIAAASASSWVKACRILGLDFLIPEDNDAPPSTPPPSSEVVVPKEIIRRATTMKQGIIGPGGNIENIMKVDQSRTPTARRMRRAGRMAPRGLDEDIAPIQEGEEQSSPSEGPSRQSTGQTPSRRSTGRSQA